MERENGLSGRSEGVSRLESEGKTTTSRAGQGGNDGGDGAVTDERWAAMKRRKGRIGAGNVVAAAKMQDVHCPEKWRASSE
jgi:hypothetical protein